MRFRDWFKKKGIRLEQAKTIARHGSSVRAAFANADRSWTEEADLVAILSKVLTDAGLAATRAGDRLEMTSGLVLRPQFDNLVPIHPAGARTSTSIAFRHPRFGGADLFEYQHASGDSIEKAFTEGFASWVQIDLPAIQDALLDTPTASTVVAMTFPSGGARTIPLHRRAVLGPPARLVASVEKADDDEHPFCPCCLLTSAMDAFKPLLEGDALYGLRLFAMRDANGMASADCRVNGQDFEPGRAALCKYVGTWPGRGFEFRKQYVIMQTVPATHRA